MLKEKDMKKEVEESLAKIKPFLQQAGGDVELVSVEDENGLVKVKLTAACFA